MLAIFHRHRPWFTGTLLAVYGMVICWAAWAFLIEGRGADELAHLPHLSILLAGLLLLAALGRRALAAIGVFALGGFIAEAVCLATGWPFGSYEYTGLGPQLAGVPLVIPVAWAVLLVYVSQMQARLRAPRWLYALVGAAWLTLLDFAVEPLTAGPLGWWNWLGSGQYYGVPLSNFAGWFVLSFILLMLAPRITTPCPWVRMIGVSVPLFALITALVLGYPVVTVISVVLLGLHATVVWWEGRHPNEPVSG
jgi:putative membrane protein